jgi:regulatory protein
MAFGQLSLKGRALRLLSQREHSQHELARKLARHVDVKDNPAAPALIQEAVAELASLGFVSDERTAASVLHTKSQRFGPLMIRKALLAKGLSADLMEATLAQARSAEAETARLVWQRKFGQAPRDARERARQIRFMAGRGFSAETLHRVIDASQE